MAPSTLGFLEPVEHSEASRRSQLRKAFVVTVTTAAGIALLSCSAPPPPAVHSSTSPTVYEPTASVVRAPLSPPVGYAPTPHLSNPPAPLAPYENSFNQGAETGGLGTWRESPRWAAIKGEGCIVVEHDPQTSFAAEAESPKFRVKNCAEGEGDDRTGPREFGDDP